MSLFDDIFSWLLAGVSVFGLMLTERRIWWAWYVSLFSQFLWTFYAIKTEQYGFILMTVTYGWVALRKAMHVIHERATRVAFDENGFPLAPGILPPETIDRLESYKREAIQRRIAYDHSKESDYLE